MAYSCKGFTKRGDACGTYLAEGKEWCYTHDPDKIAAKASAKAEAERNKAETERKVAAYDRLMESLAIYELGYSVILISSVRAVLEGHDA